MGDKAANVQMIQRLWSAIGSRDVEGYLATFTADAVAYDPIDKPPLLNSEARRVYLTGVLATFVQLHPRLDSVVPCGDYTAVKYTLNTVTASGEKKESVGIDVYKHGDDSRIQTMWGYA